MAICQSFLKLKEEYDRDAHCRPIYLYLIIEILYKSVQADNDIKGITMFNREIKNTAFADDATFMLDGSHKTFSTLINKLNDFSKDVRIEIK